MAEPSIRSIGRRVRSLPVAAAGLAALSAVLFCLRAAFDPGPLVDGLSILLTPATFLLAGFASWWTASLARDRDGTEGPVIGRFWRLAAASHVSIAVGGLAIAMDMAGGGTIRVLSMVPVLLGTGFLLAAMLGIPPRPGLLAGLTRVTVILDLAIVVGAGGMVALFLSGELDDVWRSQPNVRWLQTCIVAAVVCGVVTVAKITLHGARPIDRAATGYLAVATAFGSVIGAGLSLVPLPHGLDAAPLGLPAAGIAFVVAAERQRMALRRPNPPAPARPYRVTPYVVLGLFNGLLVYALASGSTRVDELVIGSVALTALVVGRHATALRDNARLLARLDASLHDVQRQENRFRALVRNSSDIIVITDEEGRASYVSPGVQAVLEIPPEELLDSTNEGLLHPEDLAATAEYWERIRADPGGIRRSQARFRHADGSWRWLEMVTTNLCHDPDIRGLVTNIRDITETHDYEEELAYQASHDELTGLINRSLFTKTTNEALAEGTVERTVILLVDLDDFKAINDRLGHAVGDALLVAVGNRLRGGVRPDDTVARLGGDEFALLLRDVEPSERMEIARRIIGELALPMIAGGYELLVRASVGVAPGSPGADASELLRRADLAMYAVKSQGRGRCVEFDEAMDRRATEHAQLAADLSMAIDRNELSLLYQPIVRLPSGELAAVEALVRWEHPVRGSVPPTEFIPVAERTGLIVPLGAWVLYESCQQGAAWVRELGPAAPARISVNVSARQLIEPDFAEVVEQALLASGLPASRLTVEITETAVFDGGPALQAVAAMRALGIRVALDDFGTGHSSLGLLRTCPIDVLKVDKSFVDGVGQSVEQEAIVTSLSEIGTAMRLQVIAEGVETASQADRLYVLGYRFAQGFHFDRPLPPAEVGLRAQDTPISVA